MNANVIISLISAFILAGLVITAAIKIGRHGQQYNQK